ELRERDVAIASGCSMSAIASGAAVGDAGRRADQLGRALGVVTQLPSGEVPPVAAVGVLTAELEQHMTSDFVAASGEMGPGVAELTSTLRARLGIRHRRWCASSEVVLFASARTLEQERTISAKRYTPVTLGARNDKFGHSLAQSQAVILATVLGVDVRHVGQEHARQRR